MTQVALLDPAVARWGGAVVPAIGGAGVLFGRPLGNRVLVTGLLGLSALLAFALWQFPVFFRMLTILVGVILVVAGVLKHRGTW